MAPSVAQQLCLLQVLLMLPADVLRLMFSSSDRRNLRLVCKDACDLVFQVTNKLDLQLIPPIPMLHLTRFIQKFTGLTELTVRPVALVPPTKPELLISFPAAQVEQLLYKCRKAFSTVKTCKLIHLDVTYSSSLAMAIAMPKLDTLVLQGCHLGDDTPVFEPLTSLNTLRLDAVLGGTPSHQQAFISLLSLPSLTVLDVERYHCPAGLAATASTIREVSISELDDAGMRALAQLPQLETLQAEVSLITQPYSGRLQSLKHLYLQGCHPGRAVLFLLPQPQLEAIDWEDCPELELDVATDMPDAEWRTNISQGLASLNQCCSNSSFPWLMIKGATASRQQVAAMLEGWPVITKAHTMYLEQLDFQRKDLVCLANKAPNLVRLNWSHCAKAADEMLYSLHFFPDLTRFVVSGSTLVTGVGLTAMAVALGERAVELRADEEVLGVNGAFVDPYLTAANELLEALEVSSTVMVNED